MNDTQLNLQDALEALKKSPEDKKILVIEKLIPVFERMLKTKVTFDSMLKDYFERTEPSIKNQIKAIDKRTEESANAILDASGRISKSIKDLPDVQKNAVQKEVNVIFQASNFQDLVSQHANEIKLLIEDLTVDMEAFQNGYTQSAKGKDVDPSAPIPKSKRSDAHLLNGPTTIFDD